MPTIELSHISKNFGTPRNAVQDLNLTIPNGEFACLLGPSGCGKTTTLRMIAGLELPTTGEIRVDGRILNSAATGQFIPPEQRGMGLVFQSYALWPHMTVAQIAVMHEGHLHQFAPPMEIYRQPANQFVAEFVGNPPINLFSLDDAATSDVAHSMLNCLKQHRDVFDVRTAGLRPESIRILLEGERVPMDQWCQPAIVEAILPTGAEWIVRLKLGSSVAFALIVEEPRFHSQDHVTVSVSLPHLYLFDKNGVTKPA